ncbi:MAG TPA: ABC transporter ATP-binding protein [Gammaproteobacteria bacterium]|nr:ABC transporter ATP-binding protein [Gammaproteobacteria bacterium]
MTDLAIEMQDVDKAYRFFRLSGLRIELEPGQILGFVGPNGAGKSTTIRILMALVHQDRGEVRVLGRSMPREQAIAKRDVGYMSEDMRLYGGLTLAWHMKFVASLHPHWDHAYAETLLKRFNLHREQPIKVLSHGERTKATLLLVLARRPRLLLLDEPTTGLDPVARHEILRELTDVMSDERRSILFSSQNTQDVEQISDQITFLDRGRIIESSDKETFVERWRRLQLDVPPGVALPALPEVAELTTSGRVATATIKAYTDDVAAAFTRAGAVVREVQRMTLEEIFVANVMSSRKEANA